MLSRISFLFFFLFSFVLFSSDGEKTATELQILSEKYYSKRPFSFVYNPLSSKHRKDGRFKCPFCSFQHKNNQVRYQIPAVIEHMVNAHSGSVRLVVPSIDHNYVYEILLNYYEYDE